MVRAKMGLDSSAVIIYLSCSEKFQVPGSKFQVKRSPSENISKFASALQAQEELYEKFLKVVAQAFQPVRITGAGETPALRFFITYG
jgi:hypothetical protein